MQSYLDIYREKHIGMNKVIRLNENDLRRIVNSTVRKVLKESLSTVQVRTYGLNPREEKAAREIVLQNKRVVGCWKIQSELTPRAMFH